MRITISTNLTFEQASTTQHKHQDHRPKQRMHTFSQSSFSKATIITAIQTVNYAQPFFPKLFIETRNQMWCSRRVSVFPVNSLLHAHVHLQWHTCGLLVDRLHVQLVMWLCQCFNSLLKSSFKPQQRWADHPEQNTVANTLNSIKESKLSSAIAMHAIKFRFIIVMQPSLRAFECSTNN